MLFYYEFKIYQEVTIHAFDEIFYLWDANTATPIEKVCGPQGRPC